MAAPLSLSSLQTLDRMVLAVELVKQRLLRSTAALEQAGIPYAVIGGNAVAFWVSQVDVTAVRNTAYVDLLLRRTDLDAAAVALSSAGFVRRHVAKIDCFVDGPKGKFRDALHIVAANEKVREEYVVPAPDVDEFTAGENFRVLSLESLVRMKLTSFRIKDQTHLIDLISLKMIDESWCTRYPNEPGERLRSLIQHPDVDTFEFPDELDEPEA